MNLDTYIRNIEAFLNDKSIVERENIEINFRKNSSGEIIAFEFKEKGRVKFVAGDDLILNLEMGHVHNYDYDVSEYNYHYNDPVNWFRFESKGPAPHINDKDGTHWFYDEDVELHSKDLKKDITGLRTKRMNFFLMLKLCNEFINTDLYPLDPENWNHYNKIVKKSRRRINE